MNKKHRMRLYQIHKTFKGIDTEGKEYEYVPTSPTYTPPFQGDVRVAVPAKKEDFRELKTSEGKQYGSIIKPDSIMMSNHLINNNIYIYGINEYTRKNKI